MAVDTRQNDMRAAAAMAAASAGDRADARQAINSWNERLEIVGRAWFSPTLGAALVTALGLKDWSSVSFEAGLPVTVLAGFIVGIGSTFGSGCTSGHGICGLARLSPRSLVATATFMATAAATVFVTRHVI